MVWASSPDEQLTRASVEIDRGLVRLVTGPREPSVAVLDDNPQVGLSLGAQTHVELGVRIRIVAAPGSEQDPAELTYRMTDEVHGAKELAADLIVAGNVPAVQGMLVAQVRN
ncbi:MAG: hypothetical protein QOG28_4232, partial [Trebonia sp.]|nr:hypothetical protein [Trebonia sp.]